MYKDSKPVNTNAGKTMIEETLNYAAYGRREKRPSQILPGGLTEITLGIRCPRCGGNVDEIAHGKTVHCSGCKLQLTRFGNALIMQIGAWEAI